MNDDELATTASLTQKDDVEILDNFHTDLALLAVEKGLRSYIAALNKNRRFIEEADVRERIPAGEYDSVEVDLTIKIGEVTVGEDYTQTVNPSVGVWNLLAVALRRLCAQTGPNLMRIVRETVDEIHDPRDIKALKENVQHAVGHLLAPETKTCKGKVTVKDANVEINELRLS